MKPAEETDGIRWRAADPTRLRWYSWSDEDDVEEFLVFNLWSGETHLLNITAALILRLLGEEAASLDQLMRELKAALPADTDVRSLDTLPDLLTKFDELGLVCPVS